MDSARSLFESGDKWRHLTSRLMLGILIEHALKEKTITYGQMARVLHTRHGRKPAHAASYGKPAGLLGDVLMLLSDEWGEHIPPINAILVNQETRVAGSGADYYLEWFGRKSKLTKEQRHALAMQAIDAVFDYPRLKDIARHFKVQLQVEERQSSLQPITRPPSRPRGTGPERQEHIELKSWVSKNPGVFRNYGKFAVGEIEHPLDSGDEIDVFFEEKRMWLAIEVKAGNSEAEMWRGVFQCVKYRALLRATCRQLGRLPLAQAILVLDSPPTTKIVALAKRLDIPWMHVSPLR